MYVDFRRYPGKEEHTVRSLDERQIEELLMVSRVRDLSGKSLAALTQDEIVYCHLSSRQPERTSDHRVTSCLEEVELEMRQARGRRLTSNYAPLLAGFAILDQIGSCYADAAMAQHPQGGGAIHRALYYFLGFAPLSAEVKALYALRNGLVHDASLTSQTNAGDWYIFRYDPTMQAAIKLAQKPWNGTANDLGPATLTMVNPRFFTDQISTGLSSLRELYINRSADLIILKPGSEIIHKYLFWSPL